MISHLDIETALEGLEAMKIWASFATMERVWQLIAAAELLFQCPKKACLCPGFDLPRANSNQLEARPVVFLSPGHYPYYEYPAFEAIEDECERRGHICIMLRHHEQPEKYRYLLAKSRNLKPIAYVIMPPRSGRLNHEFLKQLGIICPVVSIDRTFAPGYAAIRPAQHQGAFSGASRALRSCRFRPDAVCLVHGDRRLESVHERLDGYDLAIKEYRGDLKTRVFRYPEPWEAQNIRLLRYIEGAAAQSRVVFLADNSARGRLVFNLARRVKGEFPENWVLVHYDSLDESRLGEGEFVGVWVDRYALGREAIQAVFKLLDHSNVKDVTVPTRIERMFP